ncbi:MAG: transglutaminase family protein [Pyrinomonadaceae bacterium]|nr:transglutaminase family protein [Pyrinomonadaceae bacterium]
MSGSNGFSLEGVQFIDHRKVEWHRAKRTRYLFYQRFHYEYPGPVRNLNQRLIVVPIDQRGDQRLCDYQLRVLPRPVANRYTSDRFGNRIIEIDVLRIETSVAFEVLMIIERTAPHNDSEAVPVHGIDLFLGPTRLTTADNRITAIARELSEQVRDKAHSGYELAERISDWVYRAMRYGAGVTNTETTASEALRVGQGLCQDYAHVMIAICRAVGLPARYVSGHMLGEGSSHAWVEVLLPSKKGDHLDVVAFDPTNQRRPNLQYITVAVGRDYADVSPTSGSFIAPHQGCLNFTKKSGLTFVEYLPSIQHGTTILPATTI